MAPLPLRPGMARPVPGRDACRDRRRRTGDGGRPRRVERQCAGGDPEPGQARQGRPPRLGQRRRALHRPPRRDRARRAARAHDSAPARGEVGRAGQPLPGGRRPVEPARSRGRPVRLGALRLRRRDDDRGRHRGGQLPAIRQRGLLRLGFRAWRGRARRDHGSRRRACRRWTARALHDRPELSGLDAGDAADPLERPLRARSVGRPGPRRGLRRPLRRRSGRDRSCPGAS